MYNIYHKDNDTTILVPETSLEINIKVNQIGHSTPPHGYSSWKNKRDVYVLHYVISGAGTYAEEPFKAPCGFLMTPEELQYYTVSSNPEDPPYEQYWIMFCGKAVPQLLKNAGFELKRHIFKLENIDVDIKTFKKAFDSENYSQKSDALYMLSLLFELLSHYAKESTPPTQSVKYSSYVRKAIYYIKDFYASNICEDDIAKSAFISTKYLHKIFKKEVGEPPMHYLNSYRIKCAKTLLSSSKLSVKQIATSVGFSDSNYFCRVFQRYNFGESPLQYRKKHTAK